MIKGNNNNNKNNNNNNNNKQKHYRGQMIYQIKKQIKKR